MELLLTGLVLTACEGNEDNFFKRPEKIEVKTLSSTRFLKLYSFTVSARNWVKLSGVSKYVAVPIPAITQSLIREGAVLAYLHEAERDVVLPFTYYQMKRAVLFQSSYEEGVVYIHIQGDFILNNASIYTFKVLLVTTRSLTKLKAAGPDQMQ